MDKKNTPRARALARAWTATTLLMLFGCSQQEHSSGANGNEPVPTRSMYMHLFAETRSSSEARVIAVLTRDGDSLADKGAFDEVPSYPEHDFILDGGDAMQGCLAASCQPLEVDRLVAPYSASVGGYRAFFPVSANTDYTVMLNRPAAVSANATRAQIPSYFALTTPSVHQLFGPGEQIPIAWQPVGLENKVRVNARIVCTTAGGGPGTFGSAGSGRLIRTFPQHQGSVSISIDELVSIARASQSGLPPIGECRIFLGVAHERSGTVDPAFRGGESIGRYWVGTEIAYRQ